MSETTLVTIVVSFLAAIPPTIAAVAAGISARAALAESKKAVEKTDENTAITAETSIKADALIEKAEVIHQLTNSNLTAVKADLELANKQIKDLQELVAKLVVDRADVAAAHGEEPPEIP